MYYIDMMFFLFDSRIFSNSNFCSFSRYLSISNNSLFSNSFCSIRCLMKEWIIFYVLYR